MLCKDCEHFHIRYEPLKGVDFGKAEGKKYGLVTPFLDHRKFKWLSCVDDEKEADDN